MTIKAYAKVNIFLKIVGKRDNYHEILSRFMLVDDLYDTLHVRAKTTQDYLELHGDFGCESEQNTIYKAVMELKNAGFSDAVDSFCAKNSLHVNKNIPSFAGLGGGSSDAAATLLLLCKYLHVSLCEEELMAIGARVGADVPFFLSGYKSANVSGVGEIVEECNEESLPLEICTPNIQCDTPKVYQAFRQQYKIEPDIAKKMTHMRSEQLLQNYDAQMLNDLLNAALSVYPKLSAYQKEGWFFSGSGSSFFKVKYNG
ncbi:MAG: 4-(cytidine 5'-diphospho)-2-C-methyl-D-erythritol kinase [Sulfurospirillum sp.]|nr:4-(cytidine 5'-diphospho)-2-C-methyl-D-erythritol kinase [Sulfurospirillum sp.]